MFQPRNYSRAEEIIQLTFTGLALHCPHCQGTDIVRHGTTRQGKPRYRCRECREGRGRTFLLNYSYAGHSVDVKQQADQTIGPSYDLFLENESHA